MSTLRLKSNTIWRPGTDCIFRFRQKDLSSSSIDAVFHKNTSPRILHTEKLRPPRSRQGTFPILTFHSFFSVDKWLLRHHSYFLKTLPCVLLDNIQRDCSPFYLSVVFSSLFETMYKKQSVKASNVYKHWSLPSLLELFSLRNEKQQSPYYNCRVLKWTHEATSFYFCFIIDKIIFLVYFKSFISLDEST